MAVEEQRSDAAYCCGGKRDCAPRLMAREPNWRSQCPASEGRRTSVRLVRATDAHLVDLAKNLRPLDRREVVTMGFDDPLVGIRASTANSAWTKAAVDEQGRVVAVAGLGVYGPDEAGPWLLSTRLMRDHKKDLLRISRQAVSEMQQQFDHLTGLVDGRYRGAVRWISWLGFTMTPAGTINGAPFLRFDWWASVRGGKTC